MASLLYGAGLRQIECLTLRVKDIDFAYRQIIVRDGKGAKDRITIFPDNVRESLREHLGRTVQQLLGHESVETTMIYTHVMQKGALGVRSPLDRLTKEGGVRAPS